MLEALANKFEKESFICDGGPTPWIWRERLRIELPNGKYYFSRLDKCTTYASPLGFYLWTTRSINCTLSCDSTARFIKEFDLIIPEIIKKTSIEKKEERRQNIIDNIENTTISEMVDSTMNLLGIKKYSWENTGRHIILSIKVQGHTYITIKTTEENISEVLKIMPDIWANPMCKQDCCVISFSRN